MNRPIDGRVPGPVEYRCDGDGLSVVPAGSVAYVVDGAR